MKNGIVILKTKNVNVVNINNPNLVDSSLIRITITMIKAISKVEDTSSISGIEESNNMAKNAMNPSISPTKAT